MYNKIDLYNLNKDETFLISQKALIVRENNLLLLLGTESNEWELPGGLLEMHEPLDESLKREVMEEADLNVEITKLFCIWDHYINGFKFKDDRVGNVRVIEIAYLCTSSDDSKIDLSHEHKAYLWVNKLKVGDMKLNVSANYAVNKFFGEKIHIQNEK
jgi:8-oxo-dGTP pyrophosphatase MutT (NUDIX family)